MLVCRGQKKAGARCSFLQRAPGSLSCLSCGKVLLLKLLLMSSMEFHRNRPVCPVISAGFREQFNYPLHAGGQDKFGGLFPFQHQGRRLQDVVPLYQFRPFLCGNHCIEDSARCSISFAALQLGQEAVVNSNTFSPTGAAGGSPSCLSGRRPGALQRGPGAAGNLIVLPLLIFLCLSVVPVLYRTIMPGNPAVDLCLLVTDRAFICSQPGIRGFYRWNRWGTGV